MTKYVGNSVQSSRAYRATKNNETRILNSTLSPANPMNGQVWTNPKDGIQRFWNEALKIWEFSNPGASVSVYLTNENHTFPADYAGVINIGDYVYGISDVGVTVGTQILNYDGSIHPVSGSYSLGTLILDPTGKIVISESTVSNQRRLTPSAFDSSTDQVIVTVPVIVKDIGGSIVTINKILSYSKAKTGYSGWSGSGVSGWSGISGNSGWSGITGVSGWSGTTGIDKTNFSQDLVYSSTLRNDVSWTSGNIYSGSTYNISSGSTGVMTDGSIYYVYLDPATSTTVLQVTTNPALTVGVNKLMVAVCIPQNAVTVGTTQPLAQFKAFNGGQDKITVLADNVIAATLSSITANMGAITAGSITLNTSGYIQGGQSGYNTGTGFFLGYSSGYKFSLGTSGGNRVTWDASTLTVVGSVGGALTPGVGSSINGSYITSNSVAAGSIVAGSITTAQIQAGGISGDRIVSNTISTSQLTATAIDGMTITGATIRTSSGTTRVEMNGSYNKLSVWLSGVEIAGVGNNSVNYGRVMWINTAVQGTGYSPFYVLNDAGSTEAEGAYIGAKGTGGDHNALTLDSYDSSNGASAGLALNIVRGDISLDRTTMVYGALGFVDGYSKFKLPVGTNLYN